MQIWTSSEALFDVDKPLNSARKDVEQALNASVGIEDYGGGISKWALIYILLPDNDPNYPEVRRYKKSSGIIEFRLKVDHKAFKQGGALVQRKLLAAAVLRSVDLSVDMTIQKFDAERFKADVIRVFSVNQWL